MRQPNFCNHEKSTNFVKTKFENMKRIVLTFMAVVAALTAVLFVADFSIPKLDIGKYLFRSKAEVK